MRKSAYLKRLQADLHRWVSAGWLSEALSERLLTDATQHDYHDSQSSPILPGLAALIVVFGLLTIIAANWSGLNGVNRLLLFFTLFGAATLGAGDLRARGVNFGSNLLATIAAALAGGGLVVIGQLYHTGATTSAFLSVWTILALLMSLFLRSPFALALTSVLCILWTVFHFTDNNYYDLDGRIIYTPIWALLVWMAVTLCASLTRLLALVHLAFLGLALWITPTILDLIPIDQNRVTLRVLVASGVWMGVAAIFEIFARSTGAWATRTLAGWSAWMAGIYLCWTALEDRFETHYLSEFGMPVLALIIFSALAAYGAAPGRRWLRGAGVAGFIAVSLIFFSAADDLLISGSIMVLFGMALIALLWVTNKMLNQARGTKS